MSAPDWRTCSTVSALTVPAVPTGMKAGVRMSPRGVLSTPVRAAPSTALMRKGKEAIRSCALLAPQQAGVAVGVEAVAVGDGMGVGRLHALRPREGADQHEQRRLGQVEVG